MSPVMYQPSRITAAVRSGRFRKPRMSPALDSQTMPDSPGAQGVSVTPSMSGRSMRVIATRAPQGTPISDCSGTTSGSRTPAIQLAVSVVP
ncbi:hypothetical protein D3C83_104560 [compost metagenome]